MADLTPERTDIVERLRAVAETGCDPDLPIEAADEIERLRAVIRETHTPCVRVQNNYRTEHMVHQPGCKLYEIEP